MHHVFNFLKSCRKAWQRQLFMVLGLCLLMGLALLTFPQTAHAALPAGNALKDGRALLRYALPFENQDIRKFQQDIEDVSYSLRGLRWSAAAKNVSNASRTLALYKRRILEAVPAAQQDQAEALLDQMSSQLLDLEAAVEAQDKVKTLAERSKLLAVVGKLEGLMVTEFPFEIPAEYSNLPQLKGRAAIEIETEIGTMLAVVDGYNAPITAGNFIDLVQRGFYDGLPITRVEESYVVQFGDPPGPAAGFVDPATGKERTIPLEIKIRGDEDPIYGFTLETLGLYLEKPVLPFATYGTLGMARPNLDENGASSQVFFYLYEPDMARAGANLLDGRYAAFGYVIRGEQLLRDLSVGDKILKITVLQGLENLVQPTV
jgi:peptidylprolyl isomerase